MYPISALYADYLRRLDREFIVKVDVEGIEYDNTAIIDFTIERAITPNDEFTIGTAVVAKLTINLRLKGEIPPNARMIPYLALNTSNLTWNSAHYPWNEMNVPWSSSSTEWLPLGEFYVDTRQRVNDTWQYTCYDKIIWADQPYTSLLTFPATQQAVWNEICTILGYTYDDSVMIDPTYTIRAKPSNLTMRQVMGGIAGCNSASVYSALNGMIKFKRFSAWATTDIEFTGTDYIRSRLTNPIKSYTRIVVTVSTEDDIEYVAGTGGEGSTLYLDNPFATQLIVNDLLAELNGFAYQPIEMDARGFPQLEPGDVMEYTQYEGSTWIQTTTPWANTNIPWNGIVHYKTIILQQTLSFKGGLKMAIQSPSKSEQQSEFVTKGPLQTHVEIIDKTTVKLDKNYYGVKTSREEGLVVEREDGAAKGVFNADELTFYKGSVKALWFDVPTDTYKFKGVLEASSFIGGTIAIGSGNDIFKADSNGIYLGHAVFASAPFRVNMDGQATMSDANVTGTINATAGTISGNLTVTGSFTGGLIRTSASYPRAEIDSSNNLFAVYQNASDFLKITTLPGAPSLDFFAGGSRKGIMGYDSVNNLFGFTSSVGGFVAAQGPILFNPIGSVVLVDDWSRLAAGTPSSFERLNHTLAVNMAFDNSTRNLKLFAKDGTTLATVNIPVA